MVKAARQPARTFKKPAVEKDSHGLLMECVVGKKISQRPMAHEETQMVGIAGA